MDEVVMVKGICTKCGHMCEQPMTRLALMQVRPMICCGGKDDPKNVCGNEITNYETV